MGIPQVVGALYIKALFHSDRDTVEGAAKMPLGSLIVEFPCGFTRCLSVLPNDCIDLWIDAIDLLVMSSKRSMDFEPAVSQGPVFADLKIYVTFKFLLKTIVEKVENKWGSARKSVG